LPTRELEEGWLLDGGNLECACQALRQESRRAPAIGFDLADGFDGTSGLLRKRMLSQVQQRAALLQPAPKRIRVYHPSTPAVELSWAIGWTVQLFVLPGVP
jgi:hypothetical protein